MNNLYQTLGLDSTAAPADIQRAYKEFAAQYEPHRHGNSVFFTDRFKEVLAAYETLSDPVRRQEYDAEFKTVAQWKQRYAELEANWAAAHGRGEVKIAPPRAGRSAAGLLGFLLGALVALGAGWGYLRYRPQPALAAGGTTAVAPDATAAADSAARVRHTAMINRLNLLLDKANFSQAVQVADSGLTVPVRADTTLPDPDRGQVLFLRAIAKQELKNDSGALRDYTTAVRRGARGAAVFNNRGLLRQQLGDRLGAEQDFWLAVILEPNAPIFHLNLGLLQMDQKNYPQAEAQFRAATTADPRNAEAWLLLGNVRHELQRDKEACEAWRKGAELGFEPAMENAQLFCAGQ